MFITQHAFYHEFPFTGKQKDWEKTNHKSKLIEFRKKSKNTSEREEIFFCYEMNSLLD